MNTQFLSSPRSFLPTKIFWPPFRCLSCLMTEFVLNDSYVLILFSPNLTIHMYEGFLTLQHFKYTSKVLLFKLVMANMPDLLTTFVSEWFSLITHTYYLFSKVKILFLGCLLTWFNDFEICFVLLACLLACLATDRF